MKNIALLVNPTPVSDPQSLGPPDYRTPPTVDDTEFPLCFTVSQIEDSLLRGTSKVLFQMEASKVNSIVFRTSEAFGQMRASTFSYLLGAISPHDELSSETPLVAVLTKDNKISGPVLSLHCLLIQPTLVGV